jgi:hypothetical protein
MAESEIHRKLVRLIYDWAKENVPKDDFLSATVDLPEFSMNENLRPPNLANSIPDFFIGTPNITVVGEAKTAGDFQTNHSIKQYENYLEFLNGKKNNFLIMACNYKIRKTFKNIIDDIIYKKNIALSNKPIFLYDDNYL